MRWYMDTHKFISKVTQTALQIMARYKVTSKSSSEEIEVVEKALADAGVYKNPVGKIRRNLFTYFRCYGCLDSAEQLTDLGKLFAENKIDVKEFCFHYICNYFFDNKYFPVQLLLETLLQLYEKNPNEAYLTPYNFSMVTECNSIADINESFTISLLENRNGEVNERGVGYDIWAKMLFLAGIVKYENGNLRLTNIPLTNWLLEAYKKQPQVVKGAVNTGVFKELPVPILAHRNHKSIKTLDDTEEVIEKENKALWAFLFDNIDDRIIDKYIVNNGQVTIDGLRNILGLTGDARGFYSAFSGLERLVGYCLSLKEDERIQIIGKALTSTKLTREDKENIKRFNENNAPKINFETGYVSSFSRNRIIFGAPGTGKSFKLKTEITKLLENGGSFERVTFHPDYSYANFVGTYKPVPYIKENGEKGITYEYVPGPFSRILVKALKNAMQDDEAKPYILVVEEINRANMAAVFGDIFQLLDRDDKNVSEYAIYASEDMKKYLAKELGGSAENYNEIKLPDNMFIWATMNSADQGVFPMDTAFKRRWDFTYLGVNANENQITNAKVILGKGNYEQVVSWNELRKAINSELLKFGVNEDKLMGTFFISKNVLDTIDNDHGKYFREVFKNKVLMYLFDDAAKRKASLLFSGCHNNSRLYSEISNEFDTKGVGVFMDAISNRFTSKPSDEVGESER